MFDICWYDCFGTSLPATGRAAAEDSIGQIRAGSVTNMALIKSDKGEHKQKKSKMDIGWIQMWDAATAQPLYFRHTLYKIRDFVDFYRGMLCQVNKIQDNNILENSKPRP